jgi:hypothetical protein
MGRKKIFTNRTSTSIVVEKSQHDALETEAKEKGISVSELVRRRLQGKWWQRLTG